MWNIDDVPIFVAIVEQGGITPAASSMNISKSTVSKSLSRLEHALGVRLIDRNSRNIRVTSEGEAFYRQGLMIMEQVKEASAVMAGLTATPSGRLVVAVPMAFSREILAPNLPAFCERHPQIELDLIVTGQPVDIIRDQIDIAVVVGSLTDSELITKPIYQGELLWVTSPQYAKRNQLDGTFEALMSHLKICEKRYAQARLSVRENGQRKQADLRKHIAQVNDPITVRQAVLSGLGVSFLPSQYCMAQIKSGDLLQVYEHIRFDMSASALSVVYPSRRLISNKTRVFLEFLFRICKQI